MKSSFKVFPLLCCVAFLLISPELFGASTPLPEDIQKNITSFFRLLKEEKVDDAYQVILANTKMIAGSEEQIKNLKKETRDAIAKYGAIMGFEVIEQKRAGMSMLQVVCISLSENFPLRWRFTYYKPGDKWRLLDIFIDDKVGELFDSRPVKNEPAEKPAQK